MKILYYFKMKSSPMYTWQNYHIIDELTSLGHQIIIINPLDFDDINEITKKIIFELNNNDFSLFMTPHGNKDLPTNLIKTINQFDVKTLLICFDNNLVPYEHKHIAKYFDLVWLTSPDNLSLFKRWGANYIVMPYAANPSFLYKNVDKVIPRVVFLGTPYGTRVNTINKLLNNHIPVTIFYGNNENKMNQKSTFHIRDFLRLIRFSNGRKIIYSKIIQLINPRSKLNMANPLLEIRNSVPVDKIGEIYSSYVLCLSTTEARNTGVLKKSVGVVNLRSFEIPASGGVQFCKYNKELSTYFSDKKEILFYHNDKEMISLAKEYLNPNNLDKVNEIRKNAYVTVKNKHTWSIRFGRIFDILNIS